ncbi:exosome complex component Rrp46 [Lycorma delicatula]|uniref:exosome complex component Rrp46 n=1 Tax=Lycorma delicatula TaxID=130591 RepID=UPI003F512B6F
MDDNMEEKDVLRPVRCELNVLSKPDGSACFSQGETVVIASVFGPAEIKPQKIRNDKASIETIFVPKTGLSYIIDRQREAFMRNTCDAVISTSSYPRTGVTITIQEVQNFGSLLACMVNATSLALINSGIEMKYVVAAVSCMVDDQDNIVVDPDHIKLQNNKGIMTFAFENSNYKVVSSHTDGVITQVQYQQGLLRCKLASQFLFDYFRNTVKKYISDDL